jgi:hypothetical protein
MPRLNFALMPSGVSRVAEVMIGLPPLRSTSSSLLCYLGFIMPPEDSGFRTRRFHMRNVVA